jgi:hypothetical protein
MHKGFKCLDISTGRLYISHDVVFDENVFPFSELHPDAGARLRSEIELLSPVLFDFSIASGNTTVAPTTEINSSANPAADCDPFLEENPAIAPVFHAVSVGVLDRQPTTGSTRSR